MAQIIVNSNDNIDDFKDKVNELADVIGNPSLLNPADSDIIDGFNRIEGLVTSATDALTLGGNDSTYYLDYGNFTNTPSSTDDISQGSSNLYYDSSWVITEINSRVDKSYVDALDIDADTLDNQDGTYYLDFNNATNIVLQGADVVDNTLSISKLQVANAGLVVLTSQNAFGSTNNWIPMTTLRQWLNVEDNASADQTDEEIETAYNNQVTLADSTIGNAGSSTSAHRWSPSILKSTIRTHSYRGLPTDETVRTSNFPVTQGSNVKFMVDTTTGEKTVTLPSNPTVGELIGFVDYAGTWSNNNCIIAPNGRKIFSSTSNFVLDVDHISVVFEYTGTTQGWIVV